jgi:homoserine O-acetyltransferase
MVKRAAPIAGTAQGKSLTKLLVKTFKEAITSDPHWNAGIYADQSAVQQGLRRHANAFAASGFSAKLFSSEGWRPIGFTSAEDFLINFVEGYFLPMDPNNLLLMLNKWQHGDVTRGTGANLEAALAKISARVAVIAIEQDVFFPLADIAAEQRMIQKSELKVVSSDWGHLALFGVDAGYNSAIDTHLNQLLST